MFDIGTLWLKSSYFFLSHRDEVRKWWVIVLIALAVFLGVFVFTNVVLYLVQAPQYNRAIIQMANSPIDYSSLRANARPADLQVGEAILAPRAQNRADVVIPILNTNERWAAKSVRYRVTVSGIDLGESQDFVLPQSAKYFVEYNADVGVSTAETISVEILHVEWRHVDDVTLVQNMEFEVSDTTLNYSSVGDIMTYRVSARVSNPTFTSFWTARFLVLFFNGDQLVGISPVYVEPFESGEEYTIYTDASPHGTGVTDVSILPDINYFDDSILAD